MQVLENEAVKNRFTSIYESIHKKDDGESYFEREKFNMLKIISGSKDLKECDGLSVYGTVLDLGAMGLTLSAGGGQPYLYVLSRNVNLGTQQQPVWTKKMYLEVSPYGELSLRIAAGQIQYADTVKIVYEGDKFKVGTERTGQMFVEHEATIPRQSKTIIASYVKVVRPNKSYDISWMVKEDWERLAGYSLKQNSRGQNQGSANALYTSCNGSIDPGFLAAKTLKHAFSTFPKIALGQFSTAQMSGEEIQAIDYGLEETNLSQFDPPTFDPLPGNEAETEQSGITIEIDNNGEGW